jgi:eukaryotic-like serine/threonine-protein kinase
MTAERWAQIEKVYHAALERAAEERAAYLAQACGSDAELRREVESLLQQDGRTGDLLEVPALEMAARAMAGEGTMSLLGKQLGTYEIVSQIGAGGMGEVYRARDTKLGREVAIKVLPPEFVKDTERLSRFRREAKLLASLNHPNIATIFGLEDSGDVHFLVMELVEGETLAARVTSGPLPVTDALKISQQIAEALEHAHERKVIHRDLKPANVILTKTGRVKVLDFGLAKAMADETLDPSNAPTLSLLPTEAGRIMGTPAYMSPEQAQGKEVDKQTDIWAFGCVLYELLTGQRAFPGENVSQTIATVLRADPDWRELPSDTPQTIRTLLRRCLQKEQNRRFHSAADLAIEIEESLATPLSQADSLSLPARSQWKARPAWILVVAIGVGAVAALMYRGKPNPASEAQRATENAVATQLTNYGELETSGALAPDGRSFAFVSNHAGTTDIWVRQVSGGEPVRLTNDAAVEKDLVYSRDGETIFYVRTDESGEAIWRIGALGGQPRRVIGNARMPAPSPDGKSLSYLTYPNPPSIEMMALDGQGKRTLVPSVPSGDPFPVWSPNGQWLAFAQPGLFTTHNLFLVDVKNAETRQVTHFTSSSEGIVQQAWLPDSRHLVVSYVPSSRQLFSEDLGILDIEDGSVTRLTMRVGQRFGVISSSSDGARLLATVYEDQDEVWKVPLGGDPDANGRGATRILDSVYDPFWTFVSRDGGTLLFNGLFTGSRNLWTMPLDRRAAPHQVTMIEGNSVMHSSLSPDGTRVAFASSASGNSDIWIQNVDGSDLHQLTNDAASDYWPVWSPDGRSIVFGSERSGSEDTRVMPASGGPAEKVKDGFFRGDWIEKPDKSGTLLVSSLSNDEGIRLLDFESRKTLWEKRMAGTGLTMPVFSPDGRRISLPRQGSDNRTTIWIFDTSTGEGHVAVKFQEPAQTFFRAGWTDNGNALIITRQRLVSHIILFDRFWTTERKQ